MFQTNSEVHVVNKRCKHDLHRPLASLTVYQKGIHYAGITFYNKLAFKLKCSSINIKQFKIKLKEFLLVHTFYSTEEFILLGNT
jgi:hypothetical protein